MSDRAQKGGGVAIDLSALAALAANRGAGPDWFGPLTPPNPAAPESVAGRQWDFPSGYNLNLRPRVYEGITFAQLRSFAESYDVLRTVIETRKDQLAGHAWRLKPKGEKGKGSEKKHAQKIEELTKFLRKPDRVNTWSTWLRMLIEDLLVIDAPAVYVRRTRGNALYALEQVDGATIKPVIDTYGRRPFPPDPAYQQILKGLPAVDYDATELLYRPRNPRVHKVYGFSPVEQIVLTVNIALRRQLWQLNYYTEGNIPEALIGVPENWSPDQIKQFQLFWDATLEGNLEQRRHAKFVPGGVAKTYIPTKEPELTGALDEWLTRVVCFAFSISPLPFIKMQNRATSDTAHDTAVREGQQPLQQWVKEFIDSLLEDPELLNAPELEFEWIIAKELDPKTASEIRDRDVKSGVLLLNEARSEIGRDPVPGGDRPMVLTARGYVPIDQPISQTKEPASAGDQES